MLLLSCALAQTVTDLAWHSHGTARSTERVVVDDTLVALRVDGERAWLERYDEHLEPVWTADLELPPSVAKRHGRMAFPVVHAGGAVVVLVPMADSLAALVHDPETGERLQTRKLAEYASVSRIELLVGDDAIALLDAEVATLWGHDLEELGERTSSGSWRTLDGDQIVRGWASSGTLTLARGDQRVELDAPEGLVSARIEARDGLAWVVATQRGTESIWAAHVDFSEGVIWTESVSTPAGRPRLEQVRLNEGGVVVVAEAGDEELFVALAGTEGWSWSAGLLGQGPAVLLDSGLLYEGRLRKVDLKSGALGGDTPVVPEELGQAGAAILVGGHLVVTTRRDLMASIDLTRLPTAPAGMGGSTNPRVNSRAYKAGLAMGSGFETKHHGAALGGFAAAAVPTAAVDGGLGAGLGVLGAGAAVAVSTRWAPHPPPSRWAHLPPDFQQGYLDAYDTAVRKRQLGWVLVGSSAGLLTGLIASANN